MDQFGWLGGGWFGGLVWQTPQQLSNGSFHIQQGMLQQAAADQEAVMRGMLNSSMSTERELGAQNAWPSATFTESDFDATIARRLCNAAFPPDLLFWGWLAGMAFFVALGHLLR